MVTAGDLSFINKPFCEMIFRSESHTSASKWGKIGMKAKKKVGGRGRKESGRGEGNAWPYGRKLLDVAFGLFKALINRPSVKLRSVNSLKTNRTFRPKALLCPLAAP